MDELTKTDRLIRSLRLRFEGPSGVAIFEDNTDYVSRDAADRLSEQQQVIDELVSALTWMVDNDDTNEGEAPLEDHHGASWNELNAYWIDGLNRAKSALSRAKEAGK